MKAPCMVTEEYLQVVPSDMPGIFILVLQKPGEYYRVADLGEPVAARVVAALAHRQSDMQPNPLLAPARKLLSVLYDNGQPADAFADLEVACNIVEKGKSP